MAVVRSHLEEGILRPIPLVKQFFHDAILATQSETNRTLIPFVAGVADYFDPHLDIPHLQLVSSAHVPLTLAIRSQF
jgi:hypothetical protein